MMKQSVKKKRSQAGRRVSALVGALLLLVSVLIIPASAAYPADDVISAESEINVGRFDSNYGYHWVENKFLHDVTDDAPFARTWVNVLPEFNTSVSWSYVSFQFTMLNQPWQNLGHYTIGMYTKNGSDFFVRIGDNYSGSYPIEKNLISGDIMLGYRISHLAADRWVLECQFVVLRDGEIVQIEEITFLIPVEVYALSLELKTEYASVSANPINDYMPSDLMTREREEQAYLSGHQAGHLAGHEMGFNAGVPFGEQNILNGIKDFLKKKNVLFNDVSTLNGLLEKVIDVGYTEHANQLSLTSKLIYTALEAPVNVILGGLNFEFFGVNIASTLFAVLSIIICFAIVRVVLSIVGILL